MFLSHEFQTFHDFYTFTTALQMTVMTVKINPYFTHSMRLSSKHTGGGFVLHCMLAEIAATFR